MPQITTVTVGGARLTGRDVDAMAADPGAVHRFLTDDSQLRWLGPDKGVVHLSLAAVTNAVWDLAARQAGKPLWIEEPTSPDDVLGHAAVRRAVAPIGVATGEHCHNRVMFEQLFQAGAIDFCQLDTGRLASLNEIVAVLLLAARFDVPVCPHAGGVGLCEMVQHVSVLDYVAVSGDLTNRVTEYVDHLHEHFTDPCVVADTGAGSAYVLPDQPGYSTRMRPASVTRYRFPDGRYGATAGSAQADPGDELLPPAGRTAPASER
ncbi:enolase C-terminal domain-like protein [Streptomyces sp. B6B3]|uniref:enolase C-terminal domain-like protein n=1 Tax=Streptomyces sp. B6B3 TaxID=3153570 RepID=UPI00325F23E6